MGFRVGQLVGIKPEMLDPDQALHLLSIPGVTFVEDIRAIGWLAHGDVALVVNVHRADGSNVYVVGPHGSGWASGGMLTVIRESKA